MLKLQENKRSTNDVLAKIRTIQNKLLPKKNHTITGIIVDAVLHYYSITLREITSRSRKGTVREARQVLAALLKNKTHLSLADIGLIISRDHATVLHSAKVIQNSKDTGHIAYKRYSAIEKNIDSTVLELNVNEDEVI
jgi:chromosomal replication initiation ATPase DnaA